jgi:ribosomal protein L31E
MEQLFRRAEVLTYHLQLHGVTFKKRAPRAIKEIKAFATKSMVCIYDTAASSMEALAVEIGN